MSSSSRLRQSGPEKPQLLYVVRSGPKEGVPDLQMAFRTKSDAVRFLERVHGLNADESRRLSQELCLELDRCWHGSDLCRISVEKMEPVVASLALSGDLYLAA